jgi:anti-repressor protein
MYELVITNGKGQDITTSLKVAEVFGKDHDKVCRDIRALSCSDQFRAANFGDSSYVTMQGKELPMYEMTKDGFSFLVMGYTGERAGQFKELFISEFNKREALLKNDDYILGRAFEISRRRMVELERSVAVLELKTTEQQTALRELKPKGLFADAVAASQNSILIRELAKLISQNGIEIGEKRLFDWLRENEYLCSRGESRNLPTQRSMELGLMEIKRTTRIAPNGTIFTDSTTKVTGKGQLYFVNKFLFNKQ